MMGHPISYQEIADLFKNVPELKNRLAKDSDEIPTVLKIDMSTTEKVLPIVWRTKTQTFVDAVEAILEIEKRL